MNTTLGAGFKSKDVAYNDQGDTLKMHLWDTAGQERYDSLTKMYFQNCEAALIVYDITDEQSFEKAQKWAQEVQESEENQGYEIVKVVVGNKCDMPEN